jgi:hypothetical protein
MSLYHLDLCQVFSQLSTNEYRQYYNIHVGDTFTVILNPQLFMNKQLTDNDSLIYSDIPKNEGDGFEETIIRELFVNK